MCHSYPIKVVLPSTYLKVVFGNAQVHLYIANHGESLLDSHLMTIITHAYILKTRTSAG